MRQLVSFLALLALLAVGGVTLAEEADFARLDAQMLGYARDKNWDMLEARLAPGYQSADQNSAIGLKAALEALKSINLGDITLSNFEVTRTGSAVVLSYKAQLAERRDEKRVPRQKNSRASRWLKTVKRWFTALHANCNPSGN